MVQQNLSSQCQELTLLDHSITQKRGKLKQVNLLHIATDQFHQQKRKARKSLNTSVLHTGERITILKDFI